MLDFLCCVDFVLMLILKFIDMNFDEIEDYFGTIVCKVLYVLCGFYLDIRIVLL